ncbi:hypothetical protein HWV00_20840 (plasmid) [Moritella sp. 24]|uniref:hypothetical protein n=1 Tax=Moritella sp. 24 TaxID=2746230 RepID=UPI001BA9C3DE|nr:hypothetical protein [Moritella sp. 24]QUM78721.1 hypothetical protein HWV00_20840 [Moritella sp. 24]
MKPNDKIKLQSEAVALFGRLTGLSIIKKVPVISRLTDIVVLLTKTIVAYVAPIFERAKTIAKFHVNSKSFAEGSDSVKGVSLDVLNDSGEVLLEVQERFSLPKIKFFGSGARAPNKHRLSGRAKACYLHSRDNDFSRPGYTDQILINTTIKADLTHVERQGVAMAMSRQFPLDAHQRKSNKSVKDPDALAVIMALTEWPWSHSQSAKNIMSHEAGHRLHSYLDSQGVAINQLLRRGYDKGWHYCLSQYGTTNINEFMAEAFSCYMQDKHELIYPELLQLFKEHDKAVA